MFGKNPVSPKRDTSPLFLVHSIFYTIQGEGPFSGLPAIFVRLGGCNLKCHFCDTDFAVENSVEVSVQELCMRIKSMNPDCDFIVLTGGEPMLQNLSLLIGYIAENMQHISTVQIETAGTVWPEGFEDIMQLEYPENHIVVSPKTPKVHPKVFEWAMAWKYVVSATDTHDNGLPTQSTQSVIPIHQELARPPGEEDEVYVAHEVYLSPMDEQDALKNEANMEFARDQCLQYGHRLSLQIHKIIRVE